MKNRLLITLTLLTAGLIGCVDLRPKTDSVRVFLLTTIPADAGQPAGSRSGLSIGLRVALPSYLLTQRLAIRKGVNEIVYSDQHQWAEPLDRSVRRVLGRNLAGLLSTDRVALDAWSGKNVDYEVLVEVDEFGAALTGEVTLTARWQVRVPGKDEPENSGALSFTKAGPPPASEMAETVSVMSSMLGDLSRKLAESLAGAHTR